LRIRDGRGETRLSDLHKNRILELAEPVPRDHLLLGLQLERGWRIGSIVGCHNKVSYTRKRTGERAICIVNLPGIRKEDVGHETIMIHFKGGKTEPDAKARGSFLSQNNMAQTFYENTPNSQAFLTGIVCIITGNGPISGLIGLGKPAGTIGRFRASWDTKT